MRAAVLKRLEEARASAEIGSSLQAEVDIALHGHRHAAAASLGEDLRLVLIVSKAAVAEVDAVDAEYVQVTASPHQKCARCWHWRADIGHDAAHPQLCGRCTANLFGKGEAREFA